MAKTWADIERELSAIRPQTWETIEQRMENIRGEVNEKLNLSRSDIARYPHINDNGELLSQLLANLNYYVQKLGDLHAITEQLKIWTDRRYEMEKGLAKTRLINDDKKSAAYADGAKYIGMEKYLDIMVAAAGMDKRVQNGRSTARDTTEAVRSRIGQLRGQQRSA